MGNKESNIKDATPSATQPSSSQPRSERNPRLDETFSKVSDGRCLDTKLLKEFFGQEIGVLLHDYFSHFSDSDAGVSIDGFNRAAVSLLAENSDSYLLLFARTSNRLFDIDRLKQFIHDCRGAAGVRLLPDDDQLLNSLAQLALGCQEEASFDSVREWHKTHCPRISRSLQSLVSSKLLQSDSFQRQEPIIGPGLLSPFQFWFLQSSIPLFYVPSDPWVCLYSSDEHGLSANRFESKVFGYRGPTFLMARLVNNGIFCVGIDEAWKLDTRQWGGPECILYQLAPKYCRKPLPKSNIFLNWKNRSVPLGLIVGADLRAGGDFMIESDFSNVVCLEIWACGESHLLSEQQKQKQWELKQVYKEQKVPLPGKWDENPDRYLLELAGHQTYNRDQVQDVLEDK